MTLSSLERNYKSMSEDDIATALMRIVGPDIVSIIEKSGEGTLSFVGRLKLFLWRHSRQGKRVIKLWNKFDGGHGRRVGITQNVPQRQAHWRAVYPSLRDWQIIGSGLTYRQAQDIENQYLRKGFDGHPGGLKRPGSDYAVYTFEF